MVHDLEMKYFEKMGEKLAGGHIVGLAIDDSGETFDRTAMALRIEVGKKTYHAWVLSDEEGNDVGHLDIQEVEG